MKMTLRWLVATVHLLALVLGTGSICVRAWSLRSATDPARLSTVFAADSLWGLAALLWIGTGVWRAFGGASRPHAGGQSIYRQLRPWPAQVSFSSS
jgi:uncharacterized membrane protein